MKLKILPAALLALTTSFVTVNSNAQSWNITGNAGINPATNFIGTTDSKNFIIRTKNTQRINITPTGNILIGIGGSPIAKLEMRNSTEINSMYLSNSSTNSNQFGVRVSVNGVNSGAFRKGGEFFTTGTGSNNTAVQGQASAALANYGGDFIATDGANSNIAVSGYAGGPTGSTNYAVYGHIAGFSAGKDFAGYFDGRAYASRLLVGNDASVSSAAIETQTSLDNGVNVLSSSAGGNGVRASWTGSPTNYYAIWGVSPTTGSNFAGFFSGNVHYTGTLSTFSDERLKENIQPLASALDKIMKLKVNTYSFKQAYNFLNLPTTKQIGFLAQNMQGIFPELVSEAVDKSKGENNLLRYKAINYMGMIPILTKAIQEEHAQTDETIQALKTENEALKKRLDVLEAIITANASSNNSLLTQKMITALGAKLEQNAPNPATEKTTIHYFIPAGSSKSMIVLYAADGTKIKTFSTLAKGNGQVELNANTLAPGTYNYVLLLDGKQADSKQMIIAR